MRDFAPVSDFFLVYTDNYFPRLLPKQRSFSLEVELLGWIFKFEFSGRLNKKTSPFFQILPAV